MILELSRNGGVGGIQRSYVVDTDQLATEQVQAIKNLVAKVRPERIKQGPDRFTYTLKVTTATSEGDRSSTFYFGDGSHQELVKFLTERATQPT